MEDEENASTMLDLGVNLDDVPDQHALGDGEYKLRLNNLELRNRKEPNESEQFLFAQLDFDEDPNSKSISHVMMLPTKNDKPKQVQSRLRAIKAFYKAFQIPGTGRVIFNDYIGNSGWATVVKENDEKYGEVNRVRAFM